jgi:hypothetical protein
LLVLEAWLQHIRQNVSGVSNCLEKIEALNATSPPDTSANVKYVQGHFEAVRGFLHYMAAEGESALTCARRARKDIPLHHKRARLFADIFHLAAHQMVGDLETGLSTYQEAMERYFERDKNYHAMYLGNLCLILWMAADLIAVRQTAECLLDAVKERPRSATVPYGLYSGNRPLSPKRTEKRRGDADHGGRDPPCNQPDELRPQRVCAGPRLSGPGKTRRGQRDHRGRGGRFDRNQQSRYAAGRPSL